MSGIYNTFVIGIRNIFAFSGIVFLYFLPPLLKNEKSLKTIAFSSMFICSIYLIITVSIILFMFSYFLKNDQIMPLYTAATYIEFGSFFQRQESVFLLIWMVAFACQISIIGNFSTHIFKKIANINNAKIMVYPFAGVMVAVSLLPENYAISKFFETNIFPALCISIVFILGLSILIFANIKKERGEKSEQAS